MWFFDRMVNLLPENRKTKGTMRIKRGSILIADVLCHVPCPTSASSCSCVDSSCRHSRSHSKHLALLCCPSKLSQPARQGGMVRELSCLGWEPWHQCPSFHPEDTSPRLHCLPECPAAQTNHTIFTGFLLPYTQGWVSGSAFQGLGVKPAWEAPRMVLVWHIWLEASSVCRTLYWHKGYSKDAIWCWEGVCT